MGMNPCIGPVTREFGGRVDSNIVGESWVYTGRPLPPPPPPLPPPFPPIPSPLPPLLLLLS
eukprot:2735103-Pyramimonas_sp.AAC.1